MQAHLALRLTALTLGTSLAMAGAPVLAQSPSAGPAASPGPTVSPAPSAVTSFSPASSPSASPDAGLTPVPLLAWTQTIPALGPRGWMSQVIAWSGGFAALGKNTTGGPTVWVSTDGSAWTSHRSPAPAKASPQLGSVGNHLILVAGLSTPGDPRLASWSSTDGARWRRAADTRQMALPGHPTWGYFDILGPATAGGTAVVTGSWSGCCGSRLTPIAVSGAAPLAMAAPDRLAGTYAWTTSDGLRWVRHPIFGPEYSLECLTADGDRFLGIDYDSPLLSSADGVRWTVMGEVPIVQSADETACVHRTARGYLQVGGMDDAGGYNLGTGTTVSTDGVTWSAPITLPDFEVETLDIAVLGDLVVLLGYQDDPQGEEEVPAQFLSMDGGASWSPTSDWPDGTVSATDGRVIVAVGDGAWMAPMPGNGAPVAEPSPEPTVEDAAARWGPLAVVEDPGIGGLDAGNGPGRLVITDRCVYLKGSRGEGDTLVFRSGQTRWDAERRQIVYRDRDLGEIRLSNGDRLMLGGYGIGTAAEPDNVEVGLGPWIKEPDATCPARRWVAEQVVPQ